MKVLIVIVGIFSLAFGGPSDPEQNPSPWWQQMHQSHVNHTLANPNLPIIFLGDSLTDFWDNEGNAIFQSEYVPLGVANYGISGDRIEHVLWRVMNGAIQGLRPKLLVLRIGSNNLERNTPLEIYNGTKTLLTYLRTQLPTTKILLLDLIPAQQDDVAPGTEIFAAMQEVNMRIGTLANDNMIFHLKMFNQFYDTWGQVKPELYIQDLTHLSLAGYQEWHDAMDSLFKRLIE